MKRLILNVAVLLLVGAPVAVAQGPAGRNGGLQWSPAAKEAVEVRDNAVPNDERPSPSNVPGRAQRRDPATCPQADRPGCGDPQEVRQHQWCGREPGTPMPSRGWRERAAIGSGSDWQSATAFGRGCCARSDRAGMRAGPRWQDGASTGSSKGVDEQTADALRAALLDERRAQAFYEGVMAKHGQIRPFANIVRAERRHESAVIALMERHALEVPATEPGDVPAVPDTLRECNQLAANLERENIAMYDRLLRAVTDPDTRTGFEQLRAASLNNHLPAFERGASRPTPPTNGAGRARGWGAR